MVKLKINNSDFEVTEGLTILEVARNAGYNIPTLCHNDNLPHYSSCMVCMVKDNRSNNFIPSCSVAVQEGMDLDISGEDVIQIRQKAIELLLSEHRAECEAPCKVVCPAGYDIPLMNRYLQAHDIKSAVNLAIAEQKNGDLQCINCPGYCENACRRKKVDIPVSIRNIQLFVYQSADSKNTLKIEEAKSDLKVDSTEKKPQRNVTPKRFTSRIGKLEDSELKEWLKECTGDNVRFRDITDITSAGSEAENCMHCDCRAASDCRLRDLADELSIKDPRGKLVTAPIIKKINVKYRPDI